jgi:hypothetical protein
MSERELAIKLANLILDRPSGDPDDDLAILSRQLLRRNAQVADLEAQLAAAVDEQANIHQSYQCGEQYEKLVSAQVDLLTQKYRDELAALQSRIDAGMALEKRWRHESSFASSGSVAALTLVQCANEQVAALRAASGEPGGRNG